jgi:hypothetical protein
MSGISAPRNFRALFHGDGRGKPSGWRKTGMLARNALERNPRLCYFTRAPAGSLRKTIALRGTSKVIAVAQEQLAPSASWLQRSACAPVEHRFQSVLAAPAISESRDLAQAPIAADLLIELTSSNWGRA